MAEPGECFSNFLSPLLVFIKHLSHRDLEYKDNTANTFVVAIGFVYDVIGCDINVLFGPDMTPRAKGNENLQSQRGAHEL